MSSFALFALRCRKIWAALGDPYLRRALLRQRVVAGIEHQAVVRLGFSTLVDVGANTGQFSLAFRRENPEAKIFAFEPLPKEAEKFRSVFSGSSEIRVFEAAVGPSDGPAQINVSMRADSSSILPIADLQEAHFPGTAHSHVEAIKMSRLASVLSPSDLASPSLLKIDVQGFELSVLSGCEDLIGCFSYVYCECSFVRLYENQALVSDVIAWLSDRGFVLQGVYNTSYGADGGAIQADFLFKNSSSPSRA